MRCPFAGGQGPSFRSAIVAVFVMALCASQPRAAHAVSFKGKTITILVGSHTGGSSDLSARLLAPFIAKYLPGKPASVVQNMPGAHSLIALNYFVEHANRKGLVTALGSSSETDPINYRIPQSRYDPTTFAMVGGLNLGGTSLVMRKAAVPRLTQKNATPVSMGTVSGFPHVGSLMTAWGIKYLGWNVKWVSGYGNESDFGLALQRGEIDMAAVSNAFLLKEPVFLDKKKFDVIYQAGSDNGTVPSSIPALHNAPLFVPAMRGKLTTPVAREAFAYWRDLSYLFKWLALPPKTPKSIMTVYREAFRKTVADPTFVARGKNINPSFSPLSAKDLTKTADALGKVSPQALHFMTTLLHEEGLKVVAVRKKSHRHKH